MLLFYYNNINSCSLMPMRALRVFYTLLTGDYGESPHRGYKARVIAFVRISSRELFVKWFSTESARYI